MEATRAETPDILLGQRLSRGQFELLFTRVAHQHHIVVGSDVIRCLHATGELAHILDNVYRKVRKSNFGFSGRCRCAVQTGYQEVTERSMASAEIDRFQGELFGMTGQHDREFTGTALPNFFYRRFELSTSADAGHVTG